MLKRKLSFDIILNVIAFALPLLVLQLIALPIVAMKLGDVEYGLVVTLISMYTLLSVPFGNVLNNIRLLMNKEYEQKEVNGDFNVLLTGSLIISSFFVMLGTFYYEGTFSAVNILLIIIISCTDLLKHYLIVSFRLNLNYKGILVANIVLAVGYLVGIFVFHITGYWQFIFITGKGLSLCYILRSTNLLKEKFSTTMLIKVTSYKVVVFYSTIFLKQLLLLSDRLLLFPLMGPAAVSIYYTATVLGKLISMMITPMNSVILSYLVRVETFKTKKFLHMLLLTSILGVIGYFIVVIISPKILNILYPDWATESLELIYITTASALVAVINGVIHPFILRFKNINWQLIISGTNVTVYIVSVFMFYSLYGLIGFCIGILIARLCILALMISIYMFNKDSDVDTGGNKNGKAAESSLELN